MSCSFTDPASCVGSAASSVATGALDSIAHDFARAAGSAITWLWTQLSASTAVRLDGPGFRSDLAIVTAITGVVAVGLFVIQVGMSALRRDPGGLARAFKGLFVAFLAGGVAVAVTNTFLAAIDSLSAGVVQTATGTDISGLGSKIVTGAALLQVSNPAVMLVLALFAIVAVAIVWFALTLRKVLIVVSAVFAPLAFAGSLADITVSWTRKWIEVMAALIVSKLVLVIIFVVGWGMLATGTGEAGTGPTQSVTQLASGLLILAVAGLAPWLALRVVHFTDEHVQRLHVLGGAAAGGAQVAAAAPQKVARWTSTATRLAAAPATGGTAQGAGMAYAGGAASRPRPAQPIAAPRTQAVTIASGPTPTNRPPSDRQLSSSQGGRDGSA